MQEIPPVVADKQLPNEGCGLRGFLRETNEVTGCDRWSPACFDKALKKRQHPDGQDTVFFTYPFEPGIPEGSGFLTYYLSPCTFCTLQALFRDRRTTGLCDAGVLGRLPTCFKCLSAQPLPEKSKTFLAVPLLRENLYVVLHVNIKVYDTLQILGESAADFAVNDDPLMYKNQTKLLPSVNHTALSALPWGI